MIMVCLTRGLFVWQIFEGYEEKRFELAQLLLQKYETFRYFFPYTNSLFPGAGDATYKCLLNSGDNSVGIFAETQAKPSKWI